MPSTSAFRHEVTMQGHNSKLVLVVDDDQDLLTLVAMVLEGEGYKVLTATDGREGLDAIERSMPDLILLDMKMPIMNGWEFAKEFKSKYDAKAPIVVITAYTDAKKRAEEIGAAGWIGKPFDLDTLVNVVNRYVKPGQIG